MTVAETPSVGVSSAPPDFGFNSRLESLRGLAALAVLMTHCLGAFTILGQKAYWTIDFLNQSTGIRGLTAIGAVFNPGGAVVLFFVLSGYVLSLSFFRSGRRIGPQVLPYLIRRVFRLFPAMWASILTIAALRFLLPDVVPASAQSDWYAAVFGPQLTGMAILRNFAVIDFAGNPVTWTIYIELVGSLFVPLLVVATLRPRPVVGLSILALLIAVACLTPAGTEASHYLFCFQIGVFLACRGDLVRRIRWPGALFVGGVITLAFQRLAMLNDSSGTILEAAGATAILVGVLGAPSAATFRWLDRTPIRFLGRVSYSIYLFHIAAIYSLAQLFSALGILDKFPLTPILLTSATALLTTLVAWFSYTFVECSAIEWGRAIGSGLPNDAKASGNMPGGEVSRR